MSNDYTLKSFPPKWRTRQNASSHHDYPTCTWGHIQCSKVRKINKRDKFSKGRNKAAFYSQMTFLYNCNLKESIDEPFKLMLDVSM